MSSAGTLAATSFRDPAGSTACIDGCVYRFVRESGAADLQAFLESRTASTLAANGAVVWTRVLSEEQRDQLLGHPALRRIATEIRPAFVCEHERIRFASYPYEWCPEMLQAAGVLTLDIARGLLAEGLGLKDATPHNILFRGPDPVFVDMLSFERRDPLDPIWLPYAQFVRTFALPLLAHKYYGFALGDIFMNRRDGLEHEEVYRWTRLHQRLRPPFLSLVTLPTWFGKSKRVDEGVYQPRRVKDPEQARFIVETLLSRLARAIRKLEPKAAESVWSDYATCNNNYSPDQAGAKQRFVKEALNQIRPRTALDVGCNTGQFTKMAAEAGAEVVAIDYDPVVVGRVWRMSRAEALPVLPLVVNLARPTPATGWRNAECPSFLDRAAGAFDAVMMLAVIHHMLVTERIPLNQILETAASVTRQWAIIEFVGPNDSMFRRLTRGRDHLHADLSEPAFEAACHPFFEIARSLRLPESERTLYLLHKKRSNA